MFIHQTAPSLPDSHVSRRERARNGHPADDSKTAKRGTVSKIKNPTLPQKTREAWGTRRVGSHFWFS